MDNAVMPPTLDHVRVSTPPRSIRLGEHAFPSATDADDSNSTSTIEDGNMSRFSDHSRYDQASIRFFLLYVLYCLKTSRPACRSRLYEEASTRTNRTMISSGGSDLSDPQLKDAQSLALLNETGGNYNQRVDERISRHMLI